MAAAKSQRGKEAPATGFQEVSTEVYPQVQCSSTKGGMRSTAPALSSSAEALSVEEEAFSTKNRSWDL